MDIAKLQTAADEFDELYWVHDPGPATMQHVLLYLVELTGKLAEYCRADGQGDDPPIDQIVEEVIPDLLMHGLRLANQTGTLAGRQLLDRWGSLAWESGPPEIGRFSLNPPGCGCLHRHRSSPTCQSPARSRGEIKDGKA